MEAIERRVKTCRLMIKMQKNREYSIRLGLRDQSGFLEERSDGKIKNSNIHVRKTK